MANKVPLTLEGAYLNPNLLKVTSGRKGVLSSTGKMMISVI